MSISVIIPTYKSPKMLDLCLESAIKGQKNKNQIIVVVDGFYNINKEVLKKYEEFISILNLEDNRGLCVATNLGVYNANSNKILIVNDDNVFPKNWDEKLEGKYQKGYCWAPNQIEPNPSIFPQFHIKNLGTSVGNFDLEKFWEYESNLSKDKVEWNGSTLPIFMDKMDYLNVGGWDENYELGMVADWDFFLKCIQSGLNMVRTYNCHFYHFASVSTNGEKRQLAEQTGHQYARYKWGDYIKHDFKNNNKHL